MYGNYGRGRRPGYDSYGRYSDNYGRRGYDSFDCRDRIAEYCWIVK